MNLSNLHPAKGSVKPNTRKGRGQGSGKGGTSTRGHKGDKSRSGYKQKRGFEGGQMPLHRRLPKFGFVNTNKKQYRVINVEDIQKLSEKINASAIKINTFIEYKLASKNDLIKILGNGKITSPLEVEAHAFSKTAQTAIEAANGKIIKINAK